MIFMISSPWSGTAFLVSIGFTDALAEAPLGTSVLQVLLFLWCYKIFHAVSKNHSITIHFMSTCIPTKLVS